MREITACFVLIFLFASSCFSQPERSDIIGKKIKSVTKTIFENNDTTNKEVYKFVFSRAGDDSIQYYNSELSFKFTAKYDTKGRVSELGRYDAKDRQDEWHTYVYNRDGSYTIEIIAHGAGTISLATYDKKHWLMEEEIESSYSMVYRRTESGKTQKIFLKKNGKSLEEIAVFYFDKNGLAIRGEGTAEGGGSVYFKYNDKGLPIEIRTITGEKKSEQTTETTLLEYEYYEDAN